MQVGLVGLRQWHHNDKTIGASDRHRGRCCVVVVVAEQHPRTRTHAHPRIVSTQELLTKTHSLRVLRLLARGRRTGQAVVRACGGGVAAALAPAPEPVQEPKRSNETERCDDVGKGCDSHAHAPKCCLVVGARERHLRL